MTDVSLLRPLDQPPGTRRLLAELKTGLGDRRFNGLRMIVAFAKSGPFHRLREELLNWRAAHGQAEAIIGVDQRGTSHEALSLALELFDNVYVTQERGICFHPKLYLFTGKKAVRAFIGSHNFTVGGTETNFESAVRLDFDPIAEPAVLKQFDEAWSDLLPASCPATRKLDSKLLADLLTKGHVLLERDMRASFGDPASGLAAARPARTGLVVKPASPLPKIAANRATKKTKVASKRGKSGPVGSVSTSPAVAHGLAIQIKPHHNGEILLSVAAVREYPEFFRWPFTGTTTPKKLRNPSYPQLVPDPVADIAVYGAAGSPLLVLSHYALNTIYYTKKSEVRITAAPLVDVVPEYSVMIIQESADPGVDYDIAIHTPASPNYALWLTACNQEMPGGGLTPRKYGWF